MLAALWAELVCPYQLNVRTDATIPFMGEAYTADL